MQKILPFSLLTLLVFFLTILFSITFPVFAADYGVSGAAMNSPVPGFNAGMSLDINDSSLDTGWLKYYYTRMRVNLISTLITGLKVEENTVEVTGTGTVRGVAGYSFIATITDSSPDEMGLEIYKPDGAIYFRALPEAVNRGNFSIEVFATSIRTWSGGGTDNLASNPDNWSGNVVPQDGDDVFFDNTSTGDCTWDIDIRLASLSMNSGYTGRVIINSSLVIAEDLNIAGGTLILSGQNLKVDDLIIGVSGKLVSSSSIITVEGNWTNSGSFKPDTSTVILSGTNQTISGDNTFYNLAKIVTSADTLYFKSGSTQTILNDLTLQGAMSNLLSLKSTSQGSYWYIDPQGTRNISFVDLSDLYNINIVNIVATDSENSGNNTNVNFGENECVCLENRFILAQIFGNEG